MNAALAVLLTIAVYCLDIETAATLMQYIRNVSIDGSCKLTWA